MIYIYDMIIIYIYIIYVHICSSHLRAEPRKPIMWTFHRSAKWSRCRHCFGACADVEGCASCGEVRWCSWKCRDAWVVHVRPSKNGGLTWFNHHKTMVYSVFFLWFDMD